MEKHEWRKAEKKYYLPKNKPELIEVAPFKFVTISGEGNPNTPGFADYINALYSLSYTIKMSLKGMKSPLTRYTDYAVYPLEGIWDIKESAKNSLEGIFNQKDLVFKLMIRQPHFVTESIFREMLDLTQHKKHQPLLKHVRFETITDGKSVQILHLGSFESEPESLKRMETFAKKRGLKRTSKTHREIYLSDYRKVSKKELRTVLRFKVA